MTTWTTSTDHEATLRWQSADDQWFMDGGTFATVAEAEATVQPWLDEMLGQCADETERAGILAGRIEVLS